MHFLDEERQARAAVRRDLRPQVGQIFVEGRMLARLEVLDFLAVLVALALLDETLRARGIVKIEERRLRKRVRRTAARRMEWIAFELDGTPVNRCRDQRNRARPPGHRRGVIQSLPGNRPLDALRERDQVRFGTATAR